MPTQPGKPSKDSILTHVRAVGAWVSSWWKVIGVCGGIIGAIWMYVITPIAGEYRQNHANATATQASAAGLSDLTVRIDLLKAKRDMQLDAMASTGQALGAKLDATITKVEVTNARVEALTRAQEETNRRLDVLLPLLRVQARAPAENTGEFVTAPTFGPPRAGAGAQQ